MCYRILRISRNDTTHLPGFNEDDFVKYSNANRLTISQVADLYESNRKSTLVLVASLQDFDLEKIGEASDNVISVRALIRIILGHELHHLNVLKEKYKR